MTENVRSPKIELVALRRTQCRIDALMTGQAERCPCLLRGIGSWHGQDVLKRFTPVAHLNAAIPINALDGGRSMR
jgi:hypothetical protein